MFDTPIRPQLPASMHPPPPGPPPEEKRAVWEVCRELPNPLPAHADPEVRTFFRNFGAEFGLDSN